MTWTDLLKKEIEGAFASAIKLVDKVEEGSLGWKPSQTNNWMTVGQLLHHLGGACGATAKGFVTGDWGMPEPAEGQQEKPEDMLPAAEKLPAVASVAQAKEAILADKALALQMVELAGEDALEHKLVAPPWAPAVTAPLGTFLLMMVHHLNQHKCQLFYYLKLQGKPVSTPDLWG